jgi:hypothetical protein
MHDELMNDADIRIKIGAFAGLHRLWDMNSIVVTKNQEL